MRAGRSQVEPDTQGSIKIGDNSANRYEPLIILVYLLKLFPGTGLILFFKVHLDTPTYHQQYP